MRIGYSFWGFMGDHKEDAAGNALSTPDGNAAYSWSILWEAQRRGHRTFLMQIDRDTPAFDRRGAGNFAAFSKEKRLSAYLGSLRTFPRPGWIEPGIDPFPPLDVLLLEWRWPIEGRSYPEDRGRPGWTPDVDRQWELIDYYRRERTSIVLWDLDHKLREDDVAYTQPQAIFETSVEPRQSYPIRTRVEPPFVMDDLLQHPTFNPDVGRKLVYVGSRYERDDVVDEWIGPVAAAFPGEVEFWGKWDGDARERWPNVKFMGRIPMRDFSRAYNGAVACPLLAKRGYLETGFITPRIWEALLFGTVPVGLAPHRGIEQYLPESLIAKDPDDLTKIVARLAGQTVAARHELRSEVADRIRFMDAKNFVDELERVPRRD